MTHTALHTQQQTLFTGRLNQSPYFFWKAALVDWRFERTRHNAPTLSLNDDSRLVLFSDCHRGDGGLLDRFLVNRALFQRALAYYDQRAYTYVEVGDGDELWQVDQLAQIEQAHAPVFDQLRRFQRDQRLHLILGNHDAGRDGQAARCKFGQPLQRGLRLRYDTRELFITHGHQADLQSGYFSRMLFRHIAKPFQRLALQSAETTNRLRIWLRDLTRQIEHSYEERVTTLETRINHWAARYPNMWLICGHTHAPRFAFGNVFNTGSCLEPNVLTGLEISNGTLAQIRWTHTPIGAVERQLIQQLAL